MPISLKEHPQNRSLFDICRDLSGSKIILGAQILAFTALMEKAIAQDGTYRLKPGQSGEFIAEAFDGDRDGISDRGTGTPDCNDEDSTIYPGAVEICGDGIDQNCSGGDQLCDEEDKDSDGYTVSEDCDDDNAAVHPGATETCGDGIDQNCDGKDLSCNDVDNDGDGQTENQGDCNDGNDTIYDGAEEIPGDNIDQDCDGEDEKKTDGGGGGGGGGGCGCNVLGEKMDPGTVVANEALK